ncbi:MAG: TolC family protein [Sphingobacteriaceae bacterium]
MIRKNILVIFWVIFSLTELKAQDTVRTLNAEELLNLVRRFHPVAKKAGIDIEKTRADLTSARSAFDPILSNAVGRKTMNGVNYYDYTSPEIRIPTWFGIEIYTGLENLSGSRLDPSQTGGESSYSGISIPLAKNLLIDKRRAFLQQAKVMNNLAKVEQKAVINNLLMEAIEAYWHWVKSWQNYKVVENMVGINEKRVALVKRSYFMGERPAIDTVEAITQLQSYKYLQNEQWLQFQNAGLQLSAFLWDEMDRPYTLPLTVIPPDEWENETTILSASISLTDLLNSAAENHPELNVYDYKLEILTIDKKLKFQELLPKVDFSYNHLAKGNNAFNTINTAGLFENNFQYGLKLAIPLRFSQGRGDFRKARLKIAETRLDQIQTQLKIQLKIQSYYNEWMTLKNQTALQRANYQNYQQLVKAEETRFFNGESSLFLINSRENKALEALEKLISLKTKFYKTVYALQWSAGLLN